MKHFDTAPPFGLLLESKKGMQSMTLTTVPYAGVIKGKRF